jgi:hypothetical protein
MAKLIKNFFNKNELKVYQKYCYNKLDEDLGRIDPDQFSPAWYLDPLMNALLDTKLSLVEQESNLELFPTYAYWRYYIFGGSLKKHFDRPACEVSITTCIKKDSNWPIVVGGDNFELEEGDAVLYYGCFEEHSRPGKYKGEGMAQVFLHYVNKNGPFTHHAYDRYTKDNDGSKFSDEDRKILDKLKNEYKNNNKKS